MYIQDRHALLLAVAYTGLLIYLSATPGDFAPEYVEFFDPRKLSMHFISYALLPFLWFKSLKSYKKSILVAVFVGMLTEILQIFVPNRFPDIYDFAANVAGSLSLAFMKTAQHILSSPFR